MMCISVLEIKKEFADTQTNRKHLLYLVIIEKLCFDEKCILPWLRDVYDIQCRTIYILGLLHFKYTLQEYNSYLHIMVHLKTNLKLPVVVQLIHKLCHNYIIGLPLVQNVLLINMVMYFWYMNLDYLFSKKIMFLQIVPLNYRLRPLRAMFFFQFKYFNAYFWF